jgi:hypothetical protein
LKGETYYPQHPDPYFQSHPQLLSMRRRHIGLQSEFQPQRTLRRCSTVCFEQSSSCRLRMRYMFFNSFVPKLVCFQWIRFFVFIAVGERRRATKLVISFQVSIINRMIVLFKARKGGRPGCAQQSVAYSKRGGCRVSVTAMT